MFTIVAHSQPCVTLKYLEPCQISTMERFTKIDNGYNYFRKSRYFRNISFTSSQLYEINIMNFFNAGLSFILEVLILCKKE